MALSFTISDARHLAGITAARLAYNAANPDILDAQGVVTTKNTIDTDAGYVTFTFLRVFNSWADDFLTGITTGSEFILRFTPAEQTALINASKGATQAAHDLADWITYVKGQKIIRLFDPAITGPMAKIVTAGLLTQARANAILAY